jgi:small-conductance mechanosensitive channel
MTADLARWLLGTVAIAAVATLAVAVVARVLRALLRRHPALVEMMVRVRWPVRTAVAVAVVVVRLLDAPIANRNADDARQAAKVALIATLAWLAIRGLSVIEPALVGRFDVSPRDNRRARARRTKAQIMRRVGNLIITVVALVAILAQFEIGRDVGTGLLAASGLVGAVAAVAGRSTIGNVIAGVQIAFAEPIRLDDVVVIEDEWGNVEEITLTYVVVRLWDERRLVLPTAWFVEHPFQNWTRTHSDVTGTVELWVDYTAPVDDMRAELAAIVAESPLWDGRVLVLQVIDSSDTAMMVRALVSAADGPSAWDLRCEVREGLIAWLADHHPASLPHVRAAAAHDGTGRDGSAADGSGIGGTDVDQHRHPHRRPVDPVDAVVAGGRVTQPRDRPGAPAR